MEEERTLEGPQIVGRYALYGKIAAGGMATVHYGKLLGHAGFTRCVAIKRLHANLAADARFRAMFLDEARLVSRVRHPNVVPTLDVVDAGDELLIVMEYVHGEPLSQLLSRLRHSGERVPLPVAITIVCDVLRGLDAAHDAVSETGEPLDIIHRDVSPQNILVGADGIARVLDFGIAHASVRTEHTKEGVLKGKFAYMAPEQFGGDRITRRVDIWATSVVLWEVLCRRRLFASSDPSKSGGVAMGRLLKGEVERVRTYAPSVPEALEALVMKGLSHDPEARFRTAREMADALEAVVAPAHHARVAEWISRVAGARLEERRQLLVEVERTSTNIAVPEVPSAVVTPGGMAVSMRPSDDLDDHEPARASFLRRHAKAVAVSVGLAGVVGAAILSGMNEMKRADAPPSALSSAPASRPPAAAPALPPPPCPPDMAFVEGGSFFMGSDDDLPIEKPAHRVTLTPYCVDIHEVTTGDYKACSDRGECKRAGKTNDFAGVTKALRDTFDPLCNVRDPESRKNHPINCVTWDMARIYCDAHQKRLPTEAEWELAARGHDGRKYPWGDAEPSPERLNACGTECLLWGKRHSVEVSAMFSADDGFATTAPVGSFPKGATPYGVLDMTGNVWEWVEDRFGTYDAAEKTDPKGPDTGDERVMRGGAWNGAFASWVRPTFRWHDAPATRSYGVGFRCAKPANVPPASTPDGTPPG